MTPTDNSKTPNPLSLRDYLSKDSPAIADNQYKAPELRTAPTSLRDPAAIFGRATAVASVAAAMLFAGMPMRRLRLLLRRSRSLMLRNLRERSRRLLLPVKRT
jgi:hypothetical protein